MLKPDLCVVSSHFSTAEARPKKDLCSVLPHSSLENLCSQPHPRRSGAGAERVGTRPKWRVGRGDRDLAPPSDGLEQCFYAWAGDW